MFLNFNLEKKNKKTFLHLWWTRGPSGLPPITSWSRSCSRSAACVFAW